jgi:hypothetical protein
LSKNNNEIEAGTRDSRFVPEVQLATMVSNVSVEVSTKDRVSLNPKPHRMITKIYLSFLLSNLHEGEGNTNFPRFTITLVTPEEHLVHRCDKSPRVMNTWRSSVKCFA